MSAPSGAHSIEVDGAVPQPRCKYRVRFAKTGELRLVSHHDLMHCFERMLRRAELPFHSSEGFNPKPRMVFHDRLLRLARRSVGRLQLFDVPVAHELVDHLRVVVFGAVVRVLRDRPDL